MCAPALHTPESAMFTLIVYTFVFVTLIATSVLFATHMIEDPAHA